jgi:lipopolysaccharide transport system permease protein
MSSPQRSAQRPALHESTLPIDETIVRAPSGWPGWQFRRFWAYRDLLILFWWRDLRQRFVRPLLGVGYAALQPVFALGVMTIVFGIVLKIDTPGSSYISAAAVALIAWQLFSSSAQAAAGSMIGSQYLISSIAFPRLWLPVSRVGGRAIDTVIALPILLAVLLWQGVVPSWRWLAVPGILLWAVALALGVGMLLDAITGAKKVLRHGVSPFFSALLLASPIAYTLESVPEPWRNLYSLNPLVGVVEAMRWALLGFTPNSSFMLVWSGLCTIALLLVGAALHRTLDAHFTNESVS